MNDLKPVALSIRSLSIDAIEKAKSGHPGLPLGAAELASILYGKILKHNPKNPNWIDRDRFVLSAGHGSMLLYSILHLAGYDISLDDIKDFRQLHAKCAGHPEYKDAPGVEATTGPLGQGISTAVGMAIAERMLAAKFNTVDHEIINHYTYALVGEGCLMEGVSSEASSFAGHLKLGKLITFYDENKITIDGSTDITFSEDIAKRYESYGWQVLRASMYSYEEIEKAVIEAKKDERPSLIILKSIIGKGAPSVEGKAKAHGAPLGMEGITEAKKNLGLDPEKTFFVDPKAYDYFNKKQLEFEKMEADWNSLFNVWSEKNPELRKAWNLSFAESGIDESLFEKVELPKFNLTDVLATRAASNKALEAYAKVFPNLVGGSADLTGPNAVNLGSDTVFSPENPKGSYLHFGIREFAMATIANGLQLHGGFRAFCATFLVFSDYLRPALRLSSLMKLPVIYVFTHDSIFVGEDGPTHQPVETLASLRAIPNCLVLRPADAEETVEAWTKALSHKEGPVCLILSRQGLPVLKKDDDSWKENIKKGAYIIKKESEKPDVTIFATGSEVSLAIKASELVPEKEVRVVSVLSKGLLEKQGCSEIESLKGGAARVITVEAGVKQGWEYLASSPSDCFSVECFGTSAPGQDVAKALGFTAEKLAELIKKK